MTFFKHSTLALLLTALVLALTLPAWALTDPGDAEDVTGQYSAEEVDSNLDSLNQTQRQRAENLAQASLNPDDYDNLSQNLEAVTQAELAYEEALATGDPMAIDTALEALEAARDLADDSMSEALGMAAEEIASMRADGMGWGVICHELGLHPSVLGMGHYSNRFNELEEDVEKMRNNPEKSQRDKHVAATERNPRDGVRNGHGLRSNGSPNSDKDRGRSFADNNRHGNGPGKDRGNGPGKDHGNGPGKDNGNNGNHGNGNNGKGNN